MLQRASIAADKAPARVVFVGVISGQVDCRRIWRANVWIAQLKVDANER